MKIIILNNGNFYSYGNTLLGKGDLKTYIPMPGDLVRVIVPGSDHSRKYMICVYPDTDDFKEEDIHNTEFFNIANIDLTGGYQSICYYQKSSYIIPATEEDKKEFQEKLLKVGKFYNNYTKKVLDLPEAGDIITLGGVDGVVKSIGIFDRFTSNYDVLFSAVYNVNYKSLVLHPEASYILLNFKLATTLERREFLTILMNNIK